MSGRFLEWDATAGIPQLFFCIKNSSDEASSSEAARSGCGRQHLGVWALEVMLAREGRDDECAVLSAGHASRGVRTRATSALPLRAASVCPSAAS